MAFYVAIWVPDNSIPGPLGLFFVPVIGTDKAANIANAISVVQAHTGNTYPPASVVADIISNPYEVPNPQILGGGPVWILAGGTWNDSGVWDDSAVWID